MLTLPVSLLLYSIIMLLISKLSRNDKRNTTHPTSMVGPHYHRNVYRGQVAAQTRTIENPLRKAG